MLDLDLASNVPARSVFSVVKEDMLSEATAAVEFEGVHCKMRIESLSDDLVVITIAGSDIGEFREAPFRELARRVRDGRKVELFIDARDTKGASLEVSEDWALWLGENRLRLHHVTMLVGSRFIDLTANFVRSFSGLEGVMRLMSDGAAFDEALSDALRARRARAMSHSHRA